MSTPAPSAVHWTQPNFAALAEDDGHGDTCGPIIMLDYLHVLNGQPLDYAATDALRSRMIADGLMGTTGGTTLGNIVTAMRDYYGVPTIKYVPWEDSAAALTALHPDIIAALENHQLVAMETHDAAALPGNQSGVQNHFILAGGIDAQLGYLVANGDLYSVLAGGRTNPQQSPVWVGWQDLVNAQISSYAIWPAVENPVLTLSQVSDYFTANPDGSWHCAATGKNVRGGVLSDYQNYYGEGSLNGFTEFGLPMTDEVPIGTANPTDHIQPTVQVFERGIRVFDPHRSLDNPPGAKGNVYAGNYNHPNVLAVLETVIKLPTPPAPPAPPAPPTPTVAFGVPTVAETSGAAVLTLPYTLGEK